MYTTEIQELNPPAAYSMRNKILCLHGWRTSGDILSMQTAALRHHTDIQCSFINAPLHAQGEPDGGIKMVYPNRPYYEWTYINSHTLADDIDKSIDVILSHICHSGPFDGLLGFSQGAAMATRIAKLQSDGDARFLNHKFKYILLVGGVNPAGLMSEECHINIPNLHVVGTSDPLLPRSHELMRFYVDSSRTVLEHNEGHNIPSLRAGLYPQIKQWIDCQYDEQR